MEPESLIIGISLCLVIVYIDRTLITHFLFDANFDTYDLLFKNRKHDDFLADAPTVAIDNVETVNGVAPHEISREQQLYFK